MRILTVHNRYQQPGGEDEVFANESTLLEEHGHRVFRYCVHNDQVKRMGPLSLAGATLWNQSSYRELRDLIRRERPQVVHFHNTFPLVSPAGYYAVKAEGVPVIQTLHNYRLLCPNALFFRDGHPCEDCSGRRLPWPGVLHSCYRDSMMASGAVAAMLTAHHALRTWSKQVDVYVSLTEFARQKFIAGGIAPEKIVVKPNFVHPDPGAAEKQEEYALFVGRLSPEKGVGTLVAAWEKLKGKIPLKIVGDGPLADWVARKTEKVPWMEWLGRKPVGEVHELMGKASMLIFPSEWYETFGLVAIEAYAKGTPVVAANIGAISELVDQGRTGLLFRAGDPNDMVAQVERMLAHPTKLAQMRQEARSEYESKYTAERNYRALMDIYETATG